MKLTYNHTKYACYISYITGALTSNFVPLLFVTFQRSFNLSIELLGSLIAANFITQITVDYLSAKFIDKIGYRAAAIAANLFAAAGFWLMTLLPSVMENKYLALFISTVVYSVGSGLLEVMISPIIEALPLGAKSSQMSILHSFYCWGSVFVILLSTFLFSKFGIENWRIFTVMWTSVPLCAAALFMLVPICTLEGENDKITVRKLFSSKMFILFVCLMICSGASEVALSQWASAFAEEGLGVSKSVGDILGPCLFAVLMGIGRTAYGVFHSRMDLRRFISVCSIGCVASYLVTALCKNPLISLIGCASCGLFVAIMWPGTLSMAAKYMPSLCTTAMFALLALGGDIGCTLGPETIALCSGIKIGLSPMRTGILFAAVFPSALFFLVMILNNMTKNGKKPIE